MTTRLEIINAMLAVNGETPVSSADSNDPSAIQANNVLKRVDKRIQSRGWYFNEETFTLSPEVGTGEVIVPQNTLSVDPIDPRSSYIKRGKRLYDRSNNTYNIGQAVQVQVVLQLDIDELPEMAAAYIEAKAVKEHYTDDDGDMDKVRELKERESEAFAYLQRENLANEDVSINTSPMGSRLLREVTRRSYIPRGS